ncbi:MAG TPA: NAD(P)-dependent alcohol dehydrogenase [Nostocaceae cyanobacterium]|nr:NAD(P)-dependent alcohol dehydrogenase [Nostocaceae cyanobacterium]
MKAIIIHQYGSVDVLQYTDVEKPQIKPNQLLVKVYASSVNPIDWKIRKGMLKVLTGNKFPKILGLDVAGEVVEIGSQVTGYQIGDAIYGSVELFGGAYAEYAAVPEKWAAPKPINISYIEAATIPGSGITALQALRNLGEIQPGQAVLINGAAGGVGVFAVQIAKAFGAEVTGVCSTQKLDLVKSLGADFVIDYTQEDFTAGNKKYDIIFDAVAKQSFSNCKIVLTPNGIYISTLPSLELFLQTALTIFLPGQKAKFVFNNPSTQNLLEIKKLVEAGKVRAIIDRTYPLQELAAAHSYSETERAAGKIGITVANE